MGWVNVGCDDDTANFAVESIRRWWTMMGRRLYPKADYSSALTAAAARASASGGGRLDFSVSPTPSAWR